jgi:hypothetical protein
MCTFVYINVFISSYVYTHVNVCIYIFICISIDVLSNAISQLQYSCICINFSIISP